MSAHFRANDVTLDHVIAFEIVADELPHVSPPPGDHRTTLTGTIEIDGEMSEQLIATLGGWHRVAFDEATDALARGCYVTLHVGVSGTIDRYVWRGDTVTPGPALESETTT